MRLNRLNQLMAGGKVVKGTWRLTQRHILEYRRRGTEEQVLGPPRVELSFLL